MCGTGGGPSCVRLRRDLAGDGQCGPGNLVLLSNLFCVLPVLHVVEALETFKTAGERSEGLGAVVLKGSVDAGAGLGGVRRHSGVV